MCMSSFLNTFTVTNLIRVSTLIVYNKRWVRWAYLSNRMGGITKLFQILWEQLFCHRDTKWLLIVQHPMLKTWINESFSFEKGFQILYQSWDDHRNIWLKTMEYWGFTLKEQIKRIKYTTVFLWSFLGYNKKPLSCSNISLCKILEITNIFYLYPMLP